MFRNKKFDESFKNFLYDLLIRSMDSHNWIREELQNLKPQLGFGLFNLTSQQIEYFYELYQSMAKTLFRNIKISSNEKKFKPDKFYYHRRFGWILSNNSNSKIDNELKVFLGKTSILENTKIIIGKRTYLSGHNLIRGGGKLSIGSFSSLAEGLKVFTVGDSHPMNYAAMIGIKGPRFREDRLNLKIDFPKINYKKKKIEIGNDVWIGRNVTIKNGVKIGDGCVIGEGALVRNDCLPYGIYVGFPAKLIKYRFNNGVIRQLQEIKWWNWDMKKILKNKDFFSTDFSSLDSPIKRIII